MIKEKLKKVGEEELRESFTYYYGGISIKILFDFMVKELKIEEELITLENSILTLLTEFTKSDLDLIPNPMSDVLVLLKQLIENIVHLEYQYFSLGNNKYFRIKNNSLTIIAYVDVLVRGKKDYQSFLKEMNIEIEEVSDISPLQFKIDGLEQKNYLDNVNSASDSVGYIPNLKVLMNRITERVNNIEEITFVNISKYKYFYNGIEIYDLFKKEDGVEDYDY